MAQLLELEHLPIRLTARGAFLHGHEPLHPRVAVLFARSIVPEANGDFRLQLGPSHHPLIVEDAAYSVRSMGLVGRPEALDRVDLLFSDGAQEPLAPHTLMQSDENVLYCRVCRHGLSVAARFLPQQYHNLAWSMEPCNGAFALRLAGQLWPIGRYDPKPLPINAPEH